MYRRIFYMKFLPPGRGLWAMGSPLTEERSGSVTAYVTSGPGGLFDLTGVASVDRKLYAALNNCGFVSTEGMADEPSAPFAFLMDASMLGVGVGFDTKVS
jgi:ribonucleoside-triphosphate reductase (thioredoxin)